MYQEKDFDFAKHGCFFAFSTQQFNEQKKEGVQYVRGSLGLFLPKENYKEILQAFDLHTKAEAKARLEADGIEKIVRYEINNHECCYSGELEPLEFLIEKYGTTWEYIRGIYREELQKFDG